MEIWGADEGWHGGQILGIQTREYLLSLSPTFKKNGRCPLVICECRCHFLHLFLLVAAQVGSLYVFVSRTPRLFASWRMLFASSSVNEETRKQPLGVDSPNWLFLWLLFFWHKEPVTRVSKAMGVWNTSGPCCSCRYNLWFFSDLSPKVFIRDSWSRIYTCCYKPTTLPLGLRYGLTHRNTSEVWGFGSRPPPESGYHDKANQMKFLLDPCIKKLRLHYTVVC